MRIELVLGFGTRAASIHAYDYFRLVSLIT